MTALADMRVPMAAALAAFGVSATVTRPNEEPIVGVTVMWISPLTEMFPGGGDLKVADRQRVLVISLAEVPAVPRGTVIEAPEIAGASPGLWVVDALERREADHVRVLVVPEG
jgi:hypothetical protein